MIFPQISTGKNSQENCHYPINIWFIIFLVIDLRCFAISLDHSQYPISCCFDYTRSCTALRKQWFHTFRTTKNATQFSTENSIWSFPWCVAQSTITEFFYVPRDGILAHTLLLSLVVVVFATRTNLCYNHILFIWLMIISSNLFTHRDTFIINELDHIHFDWVSA